MFWEKQQPALRMVKGEMSVDYDLVFNITFSDIYWSGELIGMHFDGFSVNVRKYPYDGKNCSAKLCIEYFNGERYIEVSNYQYYINFVYLDALEREVRHVMTPRFIAHGIDPRSYSLDELRLVELGMKRGVKRGWELRDEKAKRALEKGE